MVAEDSADNPVWVHDIRKASAKIIAQVIGNEGTNLQLTADAYSNKNVCFTTFHHPHPPESVGIHHCHGRQTPLEHPLPVEKREYPMKKVI